MEKMTPQECIEVAKAESMDLCGEHDPLMMHEFTLEQITLLMGEINANLDARWNEQENANITWAHVGDLESFYCNLMDAAERIGVRV